MIAPWPESDPARRDPRIEARFGRFQEVLRAVREIRSRQNVPPKTPIEFAVRYDADVADLLEPMGSYFASMAGARATGWGPDVAAPALCATAALPWGEVFVDLAGLIDVEAEIARTLRECDKLRGLVAGKEKKLQSKNFVERAPDSVVQKERDSLEQLRQQLATATNTLTTLQSYGAGRGGSPTP